MRLSYQKLSSYMSLCLWAICWPVFVHFCIHPLDSDFIFILHQLTMLYSLCMLIFVSDHLFLPVNFLLHRQNVIPLPVSMLYQHLARLLARINFCCMYAFIWMPASMVINMLVCLPSSFPILQSLSQIMFGRLFNRLRLLFNRLCYPRPIASP